VSKGFVLIATIMIVVILSIITIGMIRESGSSKKISAIVWNMETLAKNAQVICAEVGVRAKNNSWGVGTIPEWMTLDQVALVLDLQVKNADALLVVDDAFSGSHVKTKFGAFTIWVDPDWQGGYQAEKSSGTLQYNDGSWDYFGTVRFGSGGKSVGTSGVLIENNSNDNYDFYSCHFVIQRSPNFNRRLPFVQGITTYKHDYVRTPPNDF